MRFRDNEICLIYQNQTKLYEEKPIHFTPFPSAGIH